MANLGSFTLGTDVLLEGPSGSPSPLETGDIILPDRRLENPSLYVSGRKPTGALKLNPEHFLFRKEISSLFVTNTTILDNFTSYTESGNNTFKNGDTTLGGTSSDYYYLGDPGQTGSWCQVAYLRLNTSSSSSIAGVYEDLNDGTHDRTLSVNSNKFSGYIYDGAAKEVVSGIITTGKDYLVVTKCDGTTLSLAVNGRVVSTRGVSNVGFGGYASPEIYLGHGAVAANTTYYCPHTIKYYIYINGLLSENEIADLYSNPYSFLVPA